MRRIHPLRLARKVVGALLLVAIYVPVHRLLDPARAGPAGAATVAVVDPIQELLRWGTLVLLLAATVLGMALPLDRMRGAVDRSRELLVRPTALTFAMMLYTSAVALGVACALGLHRGLPRLLDEMVQLLHARYMEAGEVAAPLPEPAGRLVQNSLLVPEGWTSVYPPGHTALLALGHLLDAAWVVGPFLLGVTAAFTFLAMERLYPERPGTARLAGILVALSPFMVFIGSGYLSHVSVAAAAAAALYFSVRGWQGSSAWALPAGFAAAFAVTARPWTGLLLGAFLTAGVWVVLWWREGRAPRWLGKRLAWATAGGLPLIALLVWYDAHLFGGPLTLGYEVAFGPSHGLGFHADPWGNLYGLREAIGYTGADLTALGLHLFETPLPTLALIAVFLILAPRLSSGTRILLGWAFLPVAANALYWHHGFHLGPRMLFEAAPAWAALSAVAGVGLVEGCRDPGTRGGVEPSWGRMLPPAVVLWSVILAVPAGALHLLPGRLAAYRVTDETIVRSTPPEIGASEGDPEILLFVHGSWAGRVASRLAADGMRRDSIETALRRNGLCEVHLYAEARTTGEPLPPLDLESRPGSPSGLVPVEVGGTPARLRPGRLDPSCAREARADRLGVVELAPLLWRTALPERAGALLLYRDLGPKANDEVRKRFPERVPYVWAPGDLEAPPALIPYVEGMRLLWDPPESGGGARRISGRVRPDGGGG